MKKIPMRTCLITKERLPKKELIRIVRTTDHTVVVDQSGKINGRGAYLKKSEDVIRLAQKNKALNRALECEVPQETYEVLLELVKQA